MLDCLSLANKLVHRLSTYIKPLPEGFFDSFAYTTTGNNLTHPIVLGMLSRFVREDVTGVTLVGIDVHLNLGDGTKFQPDVVGYDTEFKPLVFVDYESPNSSDTRILSKDVDRYCDWNHKSKLAVPYLIITTLPDKPASTWRLLWTASGQYNHGYRGEENKLRLNPYRFWYASYIPEFGTKCMDNIALININGKNVTMAFPKQV